MTPAAKVCPKCSESKAADQFYANAKRPDGLSSYCRKCQVADAKSRYSPHPRWRAPEGQKWCPACESIKPLDAFGSNKSQHDGKQARCKPCAVAAVTASRHKDPTAHRRSSKAWAKAHPEQHADNNAKRLYGIAHGTYARMFEAQDGRCAICKTADTGSRRRFAVDHDHKTGLVRGLLCSCCNTGIGQLKHSEEILKEAIAYLKTSDSLFA